MTKEQLQIIADGLNLAEDHLNTINKELEGKEVPHDLNSILSTAMFMRIQDIFAGVKECVRIQKPVNSLILIRTMAEALVHIKGCSEDESFKNEYINKHVISKVKRLDSIKRNLSESGFKLEEAEIDDLTKQASEQRIETAPVLPDAYQVFKRFHCLDLYHKVFSHCSLYSHNDAASMDSYVIEESDGSLSLSYEKVVFRESTLALVLSMSLLLRAFEFYLKCFNWETDKKEMLANSYNEYHDKVSALLFEKTEKINA